MLTLIGGMLPSSLQHIDSALCLQTFPLADLFRGVFRPACIACIPLCTQPDTLREALGVAMPSQDGADDDGDDVIGRLTDPDLARRLMGVIPWSTAEQLSREEL